MINYLKEKYIILEIVPEAMDPSKGNVLQISALKLDGLKLIDRFDYRLNEDKIKIKDFLKILDYGKENFKYVDDSKIILSEFKKWVEDLPLFIIDDTYTLNYLKDFNNKKEMIFKYLNLKRTDDVIEEMIDKYKLESSNYIVDLLYEALIYESNLK